LLFGGEVVIPSFFLKKKRQEGPRPLLEFIESREEGCRVLDTRSKTEEKSRDKEGNRKYIAILTSHVVA